MYDKMAFMNKQWGGHTTGFRADSSKGSGVVFEVRRALNLSQKEMAAELGYSSGAAITNIEKRGATPKSPVHQANLRALAKKVPAKVLSPEAIDWIHAE